MAVSWIGFAGAVIAALIAAYAAIRQARANEQLQDMKARSDERLQELQSALDERLESVRSDLGERLERVKHDLEVETHRREAMFDRELQAEDVLTRYRQPLAAAAFDLQSRLYNLLTLDFLNKWSDVQSVADDAYNTTLFRLCQYFGWSEILRRDIQFLSFPEDDATRCVAGLQFRIEQCFLTDAYGRELMIWRDQQRALGESMILVEDGNSRCMGYGTFCDRRDLLLETWRERLRAELHRPAAAERLRDAQHYLCELVEALDGRRVRYTPDMLQRA